MSLSDSAPIPYCHVDAFADGPFTGNPAGVCLLGTEAARSRDAAWMQRVATEMGHPATAFLLYDLDASAVWRLRWFTPVDEIQLCGHATLATAHVLFEMGLLNADDTAAFETRGGALSARLDDEGRIVLDFPTRAPGPWTVSEAALEALGVGRDEVVTSGRAAGDGHALLVVSSAEAVRRLTPDFRGLEAALDHGLIVSAQADESLGETDPSIDFVSRLFAPAFGLDEDPVTGSAHCTLFPYWAERLERAALVGRQISSRGGTVWGRQRDGRTELSGRAVTVLRGELLG